MKTEEQVAALFTLVSRLYLELGVYLSFAEYIRLIVGGQDVEDTLAKCRLDPALQTHVSSYLRALAVKISQGEELNLDSALEFLKQWTPKGKPN
jgi:hypothetical protein